MNTRKFRVPDAVAYGVVNDQSISDGSFVEAIPEAAFAGRTEAGDGGSFGPSTAAVAQGEGVTGIVFLYGPRQEETTRTNLALVNTGERDDTISSFTIALFDGDAGVRVASVPATVGPRGFLQVGAILAVHAPGTRNGWARVTRESGLNPFVAYAVVNDGGAPGQRSGDGAFVAMETGE